jgi:predicted adenine nucleotide alpha hydrolase (AANH) superfamily ATPase
VKLLLHACCGPCLLEPYDVLSEEHEVAVYYDNPNIHPVGEYRRRRDVLQGYADEQGIAVTEGTYDPSSWIVAVAPHLGDQAERCRACFALRLQRAARAAAEAGADGFATTLTVSPYQDGEAIRQEGEAAAAAHGVTYLHEDHRPRYQEAVRRSRELDMYRQNYCGCFLSEVEAEDSRRRRREERA